MPSLDASDKVEAQIELWRNHLRRGAAVVPAALPELEARLRGHVSDLVAAGLSPEEAFLVAVTRVGETDVRSREVANVFLDRLWRQSAGGKPDPRDAGGGGLGDGIVALGLAFAAAALVKLPALWGVEMRQDHGFYARNASFFVLPLLTAYFVWKWKPGVRVLAWLASAFIAAGACVNGYAYQSGGSTLGLTALHLPVALWLVVGVAYAGARWRQVDGRMDFIRFSGELFIHYVLIALGGGVLMGVTAMIFKAIGVRVDMFFETWLVPCGAAGALPIAAWLTEGRQGVVGNLAPMLTRLFTPLFAAVLIAFLAALIWTGRGIGAGREVIIAFDVLLVLVLGLLLYAVSSREPGAPRGGFDLLQLVLVASAVVANAAALWAMASRITEFGFTPNRVAAVGENLILLVNLGWSAVLYLRFLRGRGTFAMLERWQTDYLPVYGWWAAAVALLFPPIFGYV